MAVPIWLTTRSASRRRSASPPYVFSVVANAALVHKVAAVEIHWWMVVRSGHALARRKKPKLIAHLVCGGQRFLRPEKSRTCLVPAPDAVLCGRCHGDVASFGKNGAAIKAGITRHDAYLKLGCVVKGY
jgi:hypothetical protein